MRRTRTFGVRALAVALVAAILPACTGSTKNSSAAPPNFYNGTTVVATPGVAGSHQITLSWSPAVDFAGGGIQYLIFQSLVSGGEDLSSPSYPPISGTSYLVTGLTAPDTYYFIVQAQDANGTVDGNTHEVIMAAP